MQWMQHYVMVMRNLILIIVFLFLSCISHFAASILSQRAKKHKSGLIKNTVIINEQTARPDKTLHECYSTPTEEKLTRSALKSEFDKYVIGDRKTLVILDSLNYIKGFRYELHCISKASGEKHGVIWLICREEVAKKWNEKRTDEKNKYTEETMDELILRYEPPDQRNRWDRPLYRVDVHSTLDQSLLAELKLNQDHVDTANNNDDDETGKAAEKILKKSVYNMHSLSDAIKDSSQSSTITSNKKLGSSFRKVTTGSGGFRRAGVVPEQDSLEKKNHSTEKGDDNTSEVIAEDTTSKRLGKEREVKKMEDLIDAILDSFLLDVEALKEGQSTMLTTAASSNVLNDVESISQDISNAFLNAQSNASVGGGKITVPIGSGKTFSIQVNKTVQAVEMKRLRRQYVSWIKDNPPRDVSTEGIAASFLSFIENQL